MGLREDLERRQARQAAEKKSEAYYRRLWEEAHIKPDKNSSSINLYQATLPVPVSSEVHSLIKEFIQLCPDKAWKCVPEQVDREKVLRSCKWEHRLPSAPSKLMAYYEIEGYMKVRLSDESIHWAGCKLGNFMGHILGEGDALIGFHPFGIGEVAAMKRAERTEGGRYAERLQQELDQWRDIREGTQDYLFFEFYSDSPGTIIFRDGTVFTTSLNNSRGIYLGDYAHIKNRFLDFLSKNA